MYLLSVCMKVNKNLAKFNISIGNNANFITSNISGQAYSNRSSINTTEKCDIDETVKSLKFLSFEELFFLRIFDAFSCYFFIRKLSLLMAKILDKFAK